MKKYRYYFLLAFLSLFIFVVSCGSGSSGSNNPPNNDPDAETDDGAVEMEEKDGIVFTEIMYNPGDDSPEFIELVNNGTETVDMSGYTFTEGIEYTFESGTLIEPGEIIVLSDISPDVDDSLFARLPQNVQFFAPYNGQLDDGGEEIELRDAAGKKVCDLEYDDESPWPVTADGFGYSMVVADPTLSTWGDTGQNWGISAAVGGFPGTLDVTDVMPDPKVRVNEVLTHTDSPGGDAVELYNDSAVEVDISGWYLSSNKNNYNMFQIPDNTVIEPNGYLVLYELYNPDSSEANAELVFGESFRLSAHGEEIFLFAADGGELTGYAHGFSFGEVENNIPFGRYINASGKVQFIPQKERTLGAENTGPYVGYVVISEIMYHADGDVAPCNFVEITNTGNNEMILFDNNNPENTWEIDGIDFSFPGTVTIRSGERIVLVEQESMSAEDFRSFYNLDSGIQIYEYEDTLKASRQTLKVKRPEDPLEDDSVPHMVVDRAGYDEDNPGLEEADGDGASLERIDLRAYGDDYTNWELSQPGGTPGS